MKKPTATARARDGVIEGGVVRLMSCVGGWKKSRVERKAWMGTDNAEQGGRGVGVVAARLKQKNQTWTPARVLDVVNVGLVVVVVAAAVVVVVVVVVVVAVVVVVLQNDCLISAGCAVAGAAAQ